jgi:hypothetical protein
MTRASSCADALQGWKGYDTSRERIATPLAPERVHFPIVVPCPV